MGIIVAIRIHSTFLAPFAMPPVSAASSNTEDVKTSSIDSSLINLKLLEKRVTEVKGIARSSKNTHRYRSQLFLHKSQDFSQINSIP